MHEQHLDEIRQHARLLARHPASNAWDLGVCFSRIASSDAARAWGFTSWKDWASKELGISPRSAEYMRRAHDWFAVEQRLPEPLLLRLRSIPWTKVRLLVGNVTAEHAEDAIYKAETMTRSQLERALGGARGMGDARKATGRLVAMTFQLRDDGSSGSQLEVVENALDACRRLVGRPRASSSWCLEMICAEFLATHDSRGKVAYLMEIESAIGVDILAVDREAGEVLYCSPRLVRRIGKG